MTLRKQYKVNHNGHSITVVAKHSRQIMEKLALFCIRSPSNRSDLHVAILRNLTAFRGRFAGVHWIASSVR